VGDAIALALLVGDGVDVPLERLWQFARVRLEPAESRVINFDAGAHELSGVRLDGSRYLVTGKQLTVALGDRLRPLLHTFTLETEVGGGVTGSEIELPVFPVSHGGLSHWGPLRNPSSISR